MSIADVYAVMQELATELSANNTLIRDAKNKVEEEKKMLRALLTDHADIKILLSKLKTHAKAIKEEMSATQNT